MHVCVCCEKQRKDERTRSECFPEMHLADFVELLIDDDEDEVIPRLHHVLESPFKGMDASHGEIHGEANTAAILHYYVSGCNQTAPGFVLEVKP